jgi:hypothetical protein
VSEWSKSRTDDWHAGTEVVLWDIAALITLREDAVTRACGIAGRGLSEAEWTLVLPDIPYVDTCPTSH